MLCLAVGLTVFGVPYAMPRPCLMLGNWKVKFKDAFSETSSSDGSAMTNFRRRNQRVAAATVVGCLLTLAAPAAEAREGQPPDGIAAHVNGDPITMEQLEKTIQSQIKQMNQQLQQIKRSMLDRLINNMLLQQAARAEGLDLNEYLKIKVESLRVSDEEVDAAFSKSKHRFPAILESEVKYRIRRGLEDNRRADAVKRLLSKLRRSAKMQNFLLEKSRKIVGLQAPAGPSQGPPAAPLTIVEFSDFECPFCRKLQPVLRRVLKRWPKKVRLVYKHFPLDRHRYAFSASKAAVCADKQGRFWEFHDALYRENQDLSPQGVVAVAKSLGMDLEQFRECLQDEATRLAVQSDRALARRAGVTGTPTLFINKKRLRNVSQLESEVEAMLAVSSQIIGE